MSDQQSNTDPQQGNLSQLLSPSDIIFLTMGDILGAGIYAISGEAAGMAVLGYNTNTLISGQGADIN